MKYSKNCSIFEILVKNLHFRCFSTRIFLHLLPPPDSPRCDPRQADGLVQNIPPDRVNVWVRASTFYVLTRGPSQSISSPSRIDLVHVWRIAPSTKWLLLAPRNGPGEQPLEDGEGLKNFPKKSMKN